MRIGIPGSGPIGGKLGTLSTFGTLLRSGRLTKLLASG
jgi:hypothetical protein